MRERERKCEREREGGGGEWRILICSWVRVIRCTIIECDLYIHVCVALDIATSVLWWCSNVFLRTQLQLCINLTHLICHDETHSEIVLMTEVSGVTTIEADEATASTLFRPDCMS